VGGSIGAIAYKDIRQIVSYNVVIAVGFILVGLAVTTEVAFAGSIYYLVHDILVKALLFLLAGTMISLTGRTKISEISGLIRNYPLLGWTFFITVLSLTGIPPLSGFIGKVLLGTGAIETGSYVLLSISILSGFFVLYSLLLIFMSCFWVETIISEDEEIPLQKGHLIPSAILILLTIGIGLGAETLSPYIQNAAHTLMHPSVYIEAVLSK